MGFSKFGRIVWLAFGLCSAGALLMLRFATAHTVGEPCSSAVENCEKWSATVQGPPRPAGQRPDNFPDAIAIGSTSVFVGVTAVNFDTSDAYSSTASWTLVAYDLSTGAERWHVFRRSRVYDSLHDVAVSPDGRTVVATGGAYDAFPVGATDSRIVTVGFDAATGAELWSATWDNNPSGTDNGVVVAFSPNGRSVFVGGVTAPTPGELDYVTIAYDATNGTQQWVNIYRGLGAGGTNALYNLAVSPDGKKVYVTGESAGAQQYEIDYGTVAYDALSGSELWESRSQPTFVDRAFCLAVDANHVYVSGDSYSGPNGGDYQALTIALNVSDGSTAWQQRLGGSGYNGARAITAGAGHVIVTTQSPPNGTGEGLTALTADYDAATGQQLWVSALAEPARSQLANDLALAPDGRRVYLIASSRPEVPDTALDDQEVIAYDMTDGSTAWSVHLDSGTGNALTGNNVAVTSDGSSVLTLGQITRSANPLGPADQDIYDSLVVDLPSLASPPPPNGTWSIANSPNTDPNQSNTLNGVTCVTGQNCWAVGNYFDGTYYHTLIEHWDGSAWTITASPNTSDTQSNNLFAVTCASASECWAVGYGTSFETLIEKWDGNTWSIVPSPNVTAIQNVLTGVTCAAANDCWAVGSYRNGPNAEGLFNYPSLILHWDGTQWSVVSAPATGGNQDFLYQVTCTTSSNCWSVGYTSGPSPLGPFQTLIEQWDGTSWKIITSPNTSAANNNYLFSVSCASSSDCRAAGYSNVPEAGNAQTLVLHWDGATWSMDSTPNVDLEGNNAFFGIACPSSSTCFGAGYYNGTSAIQTLIEGWDGNSWAVTDSPNTSATQPNVLNFVVCSSAYDCWAVGYSQDGSSTQHTLIEHFSVPTVPLGSIVSRKTHGSAGIFDIDLTSGSGIECRSGGTNGDYTLIFTFANPLTSVDGASLTSGAGSVANANIDGSDAHNYIVNVTGVTNAQRIAVSLTDVADSAGNFSGTVSSEMGVLIGDTNSDGFVNSADIGQTKSQSGQPVTGANFREDMNGDGFLNSGDIGLVKSKSGTALP